MTALCNDHPWQTVPVLFVTLLFSQQNCDFCTKFKHMGPILGHPGVRRQLKHDKLRQDEF